MWTAASPGEAGVAMLIELGGGGEAGFLRAARLAVEEGEFWTEAQQEKELHFLSSSCPIPADLVGGLLIETNASTPY